MGLNSMTGFARADGERDGSQWHWEVKSVNGKNLDVRCRLPFGFEGLEPRIRQSVSASLRRGSCQISLQLSRTSTAGAVRVNEDALENVLAAIEKVRERVDTTPPSAEGILALKGVLETVETDAVDDADELSNAMLDSLSAAVTDLAASRALEGDKLKQIVAGQLSRIDDFVGQARVSPARQPEMIRQRLSDQIARLVDSDTSLDPDRLHQEAVVIAAKVDIQEELDRLEAHVAAGRDLLEEDEPVGRKLDFLTQELNREANTLCSKSNDPALTAIGLELKAVVDQMREQVQNIE